MVKEIEWFTTAQTAEYLQITEEVVRDKARRGVLPSSRVGQEFRFSKQGLDRWLSLGGDATGEKRAALDDIAERAMAYLDEVQEAKSYEIAEALGITNERGEAEGSSIKRALERTRRRILSNPHTGPDAEVPVNTYGQVWTLVLRRDLEED